MNKLRFLSILSFLFVFVFTSAHAQCENWNGSARETEASDAHVVYRGLIKKKKHKDLVKMGDVGFQTIMDNWQLAYSIAPAADGKRASHYSDGRKIMKAVYERTEDAAKKKESLENIYRLYDEQIQCYENEAYLLGRKGYDMYRFSGGDYSMENYNTLKASVEKGGNSTQYIVFEPLAKIMVKFYQDEKLNREQTLELFKKIDGVIKYNIDNNEKKGEKFKTTYDNIQNHFKDIAGEIFDCQYFKELLLPRFKENPDDIEIIKYVYVTLSKQDCEENDPEMIELKQKYETVAKAINEEAEKVLRAENAIYDGFQLEKEGKYKEAIKRMKEGIGTSDDIDSKAQAYYRIAHIQTWELRQYQSARSNAQKAAGLKSGWGKPFILIGDIYAKASRSCGDDWNSRLAILAAISKYRYARSIDSGITKEANKRISNYSGARPEKQEGFMRGKSAGQKAKVGCWIGETVTIEFRD